MFAVLAMLLFELPLGPGLEGRAQRIVAPTEHMQEIANTGHQLRHIRVGSDEITYVVSQPPSPPAVSVVLHLDRLARDQGDVVTTAVIQKQGEVAPEAVRAGDVLADRIRAMLREGKLSARLRGPPPGDAPAATTPDPGNTVAPAPPADPILTSEGTPLWWSRLLLVVMVASALLALLRELARGWRPPPAETLISLGLLIILAGLLWYLEDKVLHANGHGWDTARAVAGESAAPFYRPFPVFNRYGSLHIELMAWLGWGAAPGWEIFQASRVATLILLVAMGRFASALFETSRAGYLAAGLTLVHPAILGLGRSETATSTGLALLALSLLLSLRAHQRRDTLSLVAATAALACLASFRLMGPLLAPIPGLVMLGGAYGRGLLAPGLIKRVACVGVAIACSSPHLIEMATMMMAEMSVRAGTETLPPTLLDAPLWTATPWVALGAAGIASALLVRPWLGSLLVLWAIVGILAPSASAAFHQDQARYQAWMLPSMSLGAAFALNMLLTSWRRVGGIGVLVLLAWLGLSSTFQGNILATDQAEESQLRALRHGLPLLPTDAVLVVPAETRSRARTPLPDVEIETLRPDITIVPLTVALERSSDLRERPHFWLESLACSARYPGENAAMAEDCHAASRALVREPFFRWAIDAELTEGVQADLQSLATPHQPTRGDAGIWNPRPFHRAPFLAIERIVGWNPPRP